MMKTLKTLRHLSFHELSVKKSELAFGLVALEGD